MKAAQLTRRQLMVGALAGGAGLLLAACGQAPAAPTAAPGGAAPTAAPPPPAPTTAPTVMPTIAAPTAPTATPVVATPTVAAGVEKEAPMLKDLVAKGTLPPLEQRLPKNPMVLTPIDKVSNYGGQIAYVIASPQLSEYEYQFLYEGPARWSPDAATIEPNLATGYEYASDGLSMTLKFREGVKWSDGQPFSSEDLDFWWNDLVMNKDSGFTTPYWTVTGKTPMKLEVVDPTTIKVSFNEPHWLFYRLMASTSDYIRMYAPKHYLKQFHPKYNTAVKDFGELTKRFPPTGNIYIDPNLPVLTAWRTVEYQPSQRLVAERNPYYWKVDNEGRQLPYIDKIVITQLQEPRMVPLKIVSGEVDFQSRGIALDSFTTLTSSTSQGNYRVIQWKVGDGASPAIIPNWDNPDPVMRDLIHKRDFRMALSYAIDRKTINEVVYFGLGEVSQAVTSPYSPWGRLTDEGKQLMKQWRNLAVEFDPDKANKLLDQVGLDKKDSRGIRLRPDGKPLSWVIISGADPKSRSVAVLEFVAQNWNKVGIDTKINTMDSTSGFSPKFKNGEYDVAGWDAWTGYDIPTIPDTLFPIGNAYWGTPLTAQWFNTQGEKGNKPDPDGPMAKLIDFYKKMLAENNYDAWNKWILEAVKIHVSEGPFFLGAVNNIPNLVTARPNLKNIPDFAFTGSWAQGAPGCTNPPTYSYTK